MTEIASEILNKAAKKGLSDLMKLRITDKAKEKAFIIIELEKAEREVRLKYADNFQPEKNFGADQAINSNTAYSALIITRAIQKHMKEKLEQA